MRVFITGASGHIGSAVVPELIAAGHEVRGLARSDASARAVAALGAEVVPGELGDLNALKWAASSSDAVIHLALFDAGKMRAGDVGGAGTAGVAAVRAMGDALRGTEKVLVSAAAVGALGELGHPATEDDVAPTVGPASAEHAVLGLADDGVRSQVVRLPLVTHSRPDRPGFAGGLIAAAHRSGFVGMPGNGANRWPAAHSKDVARLFRLALEQGEPGRRWHAIAETATIRGIAEVLSARLDLPIRSVPDEELQAHFGFMGALLRLDLPATSQTTKRDLGWVPIGPPIMDDLAADDFYNRAFV